MTEVFKPADPLLKSPRTVVVYFLLFRGLAANAKVRRSAFERFEKALESNRSLAEEHLAQADWELLEYYRLTQTPNDASAIEFRLKALRKHILGTTDDQIANAPAVKNKTAQ